MPKFFVGFSLVDGLKSQKGIASTILLLLLLAGIGVGTYLVQQRTNLVPFAAGECGSGSGDESGCTKFTITSCKADGDKSTCDVKFEWALKSCSEIDLRVTKSSGEVVYRRQQTDSGKVISLPAGDYNAVISHANFGDDINGKDKLPFKVGDGNRGTYTWGSYSGSKCSSSTASQTATSSATQSSTSTSTSSTSSSASSNTSSTGTSKDNVPTLEGDFPSKEAGDFLPRSDKQKTLDKYLKGEIVGTIECRNTTAQSNEGKSTGDSEKNASSLWVIADKPGGDIPKQEYIIDCSKSALGSYKNWEKVKCGKLKSGSSYKYGCIDTSLKSASSNSQQKGNDTSGSTSQTTTEKQLADCGFSLSKDGVPLFAVQVGGNSSKVDEKSCSELIKLQMNAFNERIKKAQAEADEAKARGETAKAEELQKKVDEAKSKVTACEGKTGTEFANCAKEAQKVVQTTATAAQTQAIANALAKLQEIMAKKRPGGCVKADLGITPFLEAQRLKRRSENDEARRVLLCQGKEQNNLKWRVMIEGSSGSEFADSDGVDDGNDVERIYGLYGTDPKATNVTPTFPYTVLGKNSFTFGDPNTEEGLQLTLGKYIDAAKAGKTTLRSAPVEGDNGSATGSATTAKTDTPGVDGGKTNKCSSDDGCVKKNGPGYKCDKSNGQCYKPG